MCQILLIGTADTSGNESGKIPALKIFILVGDAGNKHINKNIYVLAFQGLVMEYISIYLVISLSNVL